MVYDAFAYYFLHSDQTVCLRKFRARLVSILQRQSFSVRTVSVSVFIRSGAVDTVNGSVKAMAQTDTEVTDYSPPYKLNRCSEVATQHRTVEQVKCNVNML